VITDHKLLTFAFAQKLDRASLKQCCQLPFILEFTTDIIHVPRKDNPVADILFRIDSVMMPIIVVGAQQQSIDKELQ